MGPFVVGSLQIPKPRPRPGTFPDCRWYACLSLLHTQVGAIAWHRWAHHAHIALIVGSASKNSRLENINCGTVKLRWHGFPKPDWHLQADHGHDGPFSQANKSGDDGFLEDTMHPSRFSKSIRCGLFPHCSYVALADTFLKRFLGAV